MKFDGVAWANGVGSSLFTKPGAGKAMVSVKIVQPNGIVLFLSAEKDITVVAQ